MTAEPRMDDYDPRNEIMELWLDGEIGELLWKLASMCASDIVILPELEGDGATIDPDKVVQWPPWDPGLAAAEALKAEVERLEQWHPDFRPMWWQLEAECRWCKRRIVYEGGGMWIDPEATGDDSVWRETCDEHDTFSAYHEPLEVDETGETEASYADSDWRAMR